MALVIEALFSIGLLVGAVWTVSLWRSAAHDRAVAAEAQEQAVREAALESALATPGRRLHCMNCDHRFTGPLPESGCPNCHLATLIVPDDSRQTENHVVNGRSME